MNDIIDKNELINKLLRIKNLLFAFLFELEVLQF